MLYSRLYLIIKIKSGSIHFRELKVIINCFVKEVGGKLALMTNHVWPTGHNWLLAKNTLKSLAA